MRSQESDSSESEENNNHCQRFYSDKLYVTNNDDNNNNGTKTTGSEEEQKPYEDNNNLYEQEECRRAVSNDKKEISVQRISTGRHIVNKTDKREQTSIVNSNNSSNKLTKKLRCKDEILEIQVLNNLQEFKNTVEKDKKIIEEGACTEKDVNIPTTKNGDDDTE